MSSSRFSTAVLALFLFGAVQAAGQMPRAFFTQHCEKCHSGEKPKGKFDITKLSADFSDASNREHWQRVLEQIQRGHMPPEDTPRPPEQDTHPAQ